MDIFIPTPDILLLTNQAIPHFAVIPEPFSDDPDGVTYLGTPYYDALTLRYKANNIPQTSTPAVVQSQQNTIAFQTVMIDVTQTRNIKKTSIFGREGGTFKEYISAGDYMINIVGVIVSQYSNFYPADDIRNLNAMCSIPDTLEVESKFLGYFDIHNLIVDEFSCSQKMGSRNEVLFNIKASSDLPIQFFV
jgi:Domain of unknown function (DUF6046)